jgi:cell division protein FtsB
MTTMFRAAVALLVVLVMALQLRLWVSEEGFRGVYRLRAQVAAQREENADLGQRNRRLEAEVYDLKKGFAALEERARSDLGLIGPNESFYIYSDKAPARRPDAQRAAQQKR